MTFFVLVMLPFAALNAGRLGIFRQPAANFTFLAFVHIPKTGGTAIESSAWSAARIAWGSIYAMRWKRQLEGCCGMVPDTACATELAHSNHARGGPLPACVVANSSCLELLATEIGAITSCLPSSKNDFGPRPLGNKRSVSSHCCNWHHIPPPSLHVDPRPYYSLATHRFCVVRDPYERLLSAYMAHWFDTSTPVADMCTHPLLTQNITTHYQYSLNSWIPVIDQGCLLTRLRRQSWSGCANPSATVGDCWYLPQSSYLAPAFVFISQLDRLESPQERYSDRNVNTGKGRTFESGAQRAVPVLGCNIVLRYETLKRDFSQLMELAGLPGVRLAAPRSRRPGRVNGSCFSPTGARNLLLPATRKIVQKWYARDFEMLGYQP
mmetsp:Transcript_32605/g.85676  ORF Transcript_32605/g.85676 Transcript_32605/m.85676 type:complete len:380 (-) Transcript_32605:129-1268(-)|eukprot:CAMPEP_0115828084 /NCGR_PEP_ID=MMETSP0287-20121206/390_1 /TAXON_ID=412157 /ORGANISM="Chrysochromulina rotalis, Strain UIO044" /LENGTH=379 /DNA_ID=CAMNT_0003281287 /DNA_START=137 /DNA_END=1276 /DNA_ORIENTATION=-